MAFENAVVENTTLSSGIVIGGHLSNVDIFTDFADDLTVGFFNTIDATGKLVPFDGAKVQGVTTRKLTGDITIDTYTNANSNEVSSCDAGYVTVQVVAGDTPIKNGLCYAVTTAGADKGKATTTSTSNIQAGVFWMQEDTNVWRIKLRLGGQNA